MTEPSKEVQNILLNYGGEKLALAIDALIEQRVAAALEPWEQLRMACADILGCDADWPQHGNAPLAIAAALQLRVNAERPAPEGAAPTKDYVQQAREIVDRATCHYSTEMMSEDWERGHSEIDREAVIQEIAAALASDLATDLARPRCSTPSQEDTGSVSGKRWRPIDSAPQDGTVVWVYVAAAHGLPAFQGSCAYHQDGGWCADELRPVTHWVPIECVYLPPPTDAGGPGSASNTDGAQASFQCPACRWHHGHDPAEWFAEEAKLRGFLEVVKRERVPFVLDEEVAESSPTQTVAAPGPTAGDVERTAQAMLDHIGNGDKLNMADQCRRIVTVQLSSADFIGMAKVAINNIRASARAELLSAVPRSPIYTATDTARWIITSFNLSPSILAPLRDELIRQFTEVSLHTERAARAELLSQIREQLRGTIRAVFDAEITVPTNGLVGWGAVANAVNEAERALADKLTEAK